MTNQQTKTRQDYFHDKKVEIAEMRIEVLDFLETEHKSKATKEYLTIARNAEKELHKLILPTLKIGHEQSQRQIEAKEELRQYEELKRELTNIQKMLTDDFAQKKNEESSDWVKNAGYITAAALAAVTLFKDPLTLKTALLAASGAVAGACVVWNKKIRKEFSLAAKGVTARVAKAKEKVKDPETSRNVREGFDKICSPLRSEKSFVIVVGKKTYTKLEAV